MIRAIFQKELLDHWRDRRSVLGAFILPIIGPLFVWLMFSFISNMQSNQELTLPVVNAAQAPQLVAFLEQHGVVVEPPPKQPESAVLEGDIDVILRIESEFQERFRGGRSAPLSLIVDTSNHQAQTSVRKVERLLVAYAQQLGAQRLLVRGISPEVAQPLALVAVDLASPEKITAKLLNMIPLFLMLAAMVGGMNVAIDTTAGERERGSLESLLLNPVPRSKLVLGKWLATVTAALVVTVAAILGFTVAIHFIPLEDIGMKVSWGLAETLLILLVVAPLAFFGGALQMLVATFARSFKEAQTYLGLLNLIPTLPAVFLMLNPSRGQWWLSLIPTVAQVDSITELIRGEPLPLSNIALAWASAGILTALCLVALTRMLRREKIIFGR